MEIPGTTSTEFLERIGKKSLAAPLFLTVSGMAQPINPAITPGDPTTAAPAVAPTGGGGAAVHGCNDQEGSMSTASSAIRPTGPSYGTVTDLLPLRQIKLDVLFRF